MSATALAGLWFAATQPFVSSIAWSGQKASPDKLEDHVVQLATLLPERSDDVDKLDVSAEYIYGEFQQYGKAAYQVFDVWGIQYRNVILHMDRKAEKTVVVGAHYDAFDGLPGADDNASGVAGLLELARLLDASTPDLNVELVAYALEEPPYFGTENMGSYHHAQQSDADLIIVLEMIGYFRDTRGSQNYPLPFLRHLYSDKGDFIALVGRFNEFSSIRTMKAAFLGAAEISTYSLTFPPILSGVSFSDHRNYWLRGRNAVMITDTAFERNPHYHTDEDTPDKLDYAKMAEVVTGVYASLFALAHNE
ncbi:MAG: M28 family peptidase [Gammaproteobacteria bacterium]